MLIIDFGESFSGELAARLSQFGPVRIEWPAENNRTRRRTNHGKKNFFHNRSILFLFSFSFRKIGLRLCDL